MIISIALSISLAQAAATPAPASTVEEPAKEDKAERKICERSDVTGTRLKRVRICLTQRQWDLRRDEIRDATAHTREPGSGDNLNLPRGPAAPR